MKTKMIAYFWAVALAFCTSSNEVSAQTKGFKDDTVQTRVLKVTDDDSSKTVRMVIFEVLVISGDINHDFNNRDWLKRISGELKSTGGHWGIQNWELSLLRKYDTLTYVGDVMFNQNLLEVPTNFPLTPTYYRFRISADVNTKMLTPGDSLQINMVLEIGKDWETPEGFFPKPQYLVYGEKIPNSTGTTTKFDSPEYKIFPNPFTNIINLSTFKSVKNVMLMGGVGQVMYSGNESSIETSNLVSGIYTLYIYTENKIFTYKLCKN
ncbi:T9SS type A sorting domain-containing protein [Candidatus Nomurabacteria bacterium]|nr:T9SS type A sorting domain-containing protein [Candidatus Nomurabacteria bacterium]